MTDAIYKDANQAIEARINDLLAKMTIEEKLGQLNQLFSEYSFTSVAQYDDQARNGKISSFIWGKALPKERNRIQRIAMEESRLGIPIIFAWDIIHGNRTIFPIAPAMACSFEPELLEKAQAVAAMETRAEGVEWIFAPMCDLARDHRWGRIAESCGEDPYLSALCNAAQVKGFQGDNPSSDDKVAACLKHYVGYSVPRGGRDYSDTEITEWTLRNSHLPPFKAGVDAGVLSIMSGFNAIGGIPAVANRHALTEILREEWGFEGFVVSDWNAVREQISWGYAKDEAQAAKFAITAGNDMDMLTSCYLTTLAQQLEDGSISINVIDTAVKRVLGVKFKVGLFEKPYADEAAYEKVILKPESRALAREAVTKSVVMIKNEGALPVANCVKKIALIGPFVNDKSEMVGSWAGRAVASDMVTLQEGIQTRFGTQAEITVVKGCNVNNQPQIVCLPDGSTVLDKDADEDVELNIPGAIEATRNADVVIMALGEPKGLTGEGGSRATLGLTGHQQELFDAVADTTDKSIISVMFSGRTLATPEVFKKSSAVLLAWQLGLESGNGLADIISGDVSPSGRLCMSIPYSVGQVPLYYNHYVTGRRSGGVYRDAVPTAANYWFGYGLTYTSFEYSDCQIIPAENNQPAIAKAIITNTGDQAGTETVQLYIRQMACSHAARPMQELRGFKRLQLKPGDKAEVQFPLTDDVLSYTSREGQECVDEGEFQIWIAPHARCGEAMMYNHIK